MSFFNLTLAVCCGVFFGKSLYSLYWDGFLPCIKKLHSTRAREFLSALLVVLIGAAVLGMLVWSVKFARDQDITLSATEEPFLKNDPPSVAVIVPPIPAISVDEPRLLPPPQIPPSRQRPIYINGRKGYLQSLRIWWEDTEKFEHFSAYNLPVPPLTFE